MRRPMESPLIWREGAATLDPMIRAPTLAALLVAATLGLFGPCAMGEETPARPNGVTQSLEARQQDKQRREEELRAIEGSIRQSDDDKLRAIKLIESLRDDRVKLTKDLIDTTKRVQTTDEKISVIVLKLDALQTQELALKASLDARRDVMVQVLAALQRLGAKPPPAVLVKPDDVLDAVRASIMLGGVLPGLRAEAQQLADDLKALIDNRSAQADERDALVREKLSIVADRERLAALVSSRQGQIDASEQQLREDRQKITTLAKQAQSLKDLIGRMESDIAGAARAAEAAKKVPLPSGQIASVSSFASANAGDPARLSPKFAFADLKGALKLPAAGPIVKTFGVPDGYGGTEKGLTLAPPAGAIISAPNDGWVAFSGVYRSYGQVLILNAGSGYHMVLIGIDHALVDVGQFVLAGEPIAVMAAARDNAPGPDAPKSDLRKDDPPKNVVLRSDGSSTDVAKSDLPLRGRSLYIELRKDGQPIDSAPWWAQTSNEKARG